MSLTLSGQLGSAQLGAAELGALQTVTTDAGFPLFFPDVGPVKQAEATQPKKRKKRKTKVEKKKPKRVKIKASVPAKSAPAPACLTAPTVLEPAPVLDTAVALALQEELYRQAQLRETITEEDELLLMVFSHGNG